MRITRITAAGIADHSLLNGLGLVFFMADSLEENFELEDVLLSDAESERGQNDSAPFVQLNSSQSTQVEAAPDQKVSRKLESKAKKSKKPKSMTNLTAEDLGINAESRSEKTFIELLDNLYADQPKPLVVKSHAKVKVLIVCSGALRCLEVIKNLKSVPQLKVAKLFAKHMKMEEQIRALKKTPFLIAVGTPARIMKILEQDEGAIPLKKLDYLIIDGTFKNKKSMTVYDLLDTQMDLKKLTAHLQDHVEAIINI